MENDLCFNLVKHIFEQIYLFCVFYSGVTLSTYCRASAGVAGSPAGLQDCQCSSREDVNCYHTYVQSLVDQAPVCCKFSECVQNTPFGMFLDGASVAARFEFVYMLNLYTCFKS